LDSDDVGAADKYLVASFADKQVRLSKVVMTHDDRRSSGFTLIELLVVIAIIGTLVALLLPAVQAARETARRSHCTNHLKQIGLALHNYESAHRTLPYAAGDCCTPGDLTARGGTWPTMILPFLEENSLYDLMDFKKHMQEQTLAVVTTVVEAYLCPSDVTASEAVLDDRFGWHNPPRAAGLWYTASMGPTMPDGCPLCPAGSIPSSSNYCCQGNNFGTLPGNGYPAGSTVGMFGRYHKAISFAEVRDGLSKTIMIGETLPRDCIFISVFAVNFNVSPTTIPLNTMLNDSGQVTDWWQTCGFKSRHPGGANLAMGDASVHFFAEEMDFKLYNELGTRAGGETCTWPN
jgi:prepilin-type N-terminal cleavage/methylation domain-containing protein/prepilin-type processing-associated H-X9-DG protein